MSEEDPIGKYKLDDFLVRLHLLTHQMKEVEETVDSLKHTLHGNGRAGLKTSVELMEARLDQIHKSSAEDTKGRWLVIVALITAATSGIVSIIKIIADHIR